MFEKWGGGGWGGAGHPDPEIRGSQVSNKHIFQPVWSLTTRGGPGSATFFITGWSMYNCIYMIACLMGKVWVGVHHLWEVFDRC